MTWRHVPTKQNPADLLTRGPNVSALIEEERWWKGPAFLVQEETGRPEKGIEAKEEADMEVRNSLKKEMRNSALKFSPQ